MERFCTRLTAKLRGLASTRAELVAFGRFFRNPKVTAAEIVETAARRTGEVASGRHVLLIQDTSEINYQSKAGRKRGLGKVGNGSDMGLFVHPVVVVDATGPADILGLGAALIWCRHRTKATDYQSQPIETKESYRWIETALSARQALVDSPLATVIADRESDIYEVFARLPEAGRTHVLLRCHHDRALGDRPLRLSAEIATWPVAGQAQFDLDARPGRPGRHVVLAVRFGEVVLRQPKCGADPKDPKTLKLNLVEVIEIDPPLGVPPVHWRLYTTHEVKTLQQANHVVDLYRRRWLIEQVFRTLKSQGLDIEESLLADGHALESLAATALIAAIKVMQCVHARDQAGQNIPASRVFSQTDLPVLHALTRKLQGATQKQKNPHPPESLPWAVWVIARLGGWTGYASERPPGPITILNGLNRYNEIATGFALATI